MQQTDFKTRGFTLWQLCGVLLIVSVTAAFLYPVVTNCAVGDGKQVEAECMGNLKQIGLATLSYAEDFDGTLPPAVTKTTVAQRVESAVQQEYRRHFAYGSKSPIYIETLNYWLGRTGNEYLDGKGIGRRISFGTSGFLSPYLKRAGAVQCPEFIATYQNMVYLTNDLAGGASLQTIARPSVSIVAMDGEANFATTGHAYKPSNEDKRWREEKWKDGENGALFSAVERHNGGANYLFADGHAKRNIPEDVFFPPQTWQIPSHSDPRADLSFAPDPSGNMVYKGHKYAATFHLR